MTKSRPVVIAMSVLAGAQVLVTGAGFADIVPAKVAGLCVLLVAAAQFGVQFYVQNVVVPLKDTAAYRSKHGDIVSGPAAPPEEQPVAVVPDPPA